MWSKTVSIILASFVCVMLLFTQMHINTNEVFTSRRPSFSFYRGMLTGCFAESKTYPDDGTCLRKALFLSPAGIKKRLAPLEAYLIKTIFFASNGVNLLYKIFVLPKKPDESGCLRKGIITTLRLHHNGILQAWSAESGSRLKRLKPARQDCLK